MHKRGFSSQGVERAWSGRARAALLALLVLSWSPGFLPAEEVESSVDSEQGESEPPPLVPKGWYPLVSVGFDIQFSANSASVSSDTVPTLGVTPEYPPATTIPPEEYPYCGPGSGGEPYVCTPGVRSYSGGKSNVGVSSAMINIGTTLFAPVLFEDLWDLRPFFEARGQLPTRIQYTVYSASRPFEPEKKEIFRRGEWTNTDVFASSTSIHATVGQVGNWFFGAGLDFSLPLFNDRRVAIQPSLSYFGERVKFAANYYTKEFANPLVPFSGYFSKDNGVPVMILAKQNYATYHGIAPRIAFDAMLFRRGPILFSLYAEYQAMIILNDTDLVFQAENEIGSGTARLEFSTEEVQHQVGFGFKVAWVKWSLFGD